MSRNEETKPLPPIEILNHMIHYDKEKGILTWKNSSKTSRNGMMCGHGRGRSGYRVVGILMSQYLYHRIAYFIHTGIDPFGYIVDHKDGDPTNNKPSNLRLASRSQNNANGRPYKTSKTGFRGAFWQKSMKKYCASIQSEGKREVIGYFNCPTEAARAYDRKAIRMFGEYAKTNFPLEDYQND